MQRTDIHMKKESKSQTTGVLFYRFLQERKVSLQQKWVIWPVDHCLFKSIKLSLKGTVLT